MQYRNGKAEEIKIAYVGGGSRGWAWKLMSELARAEDIGGEVRLYDIDFGAAEANAVIGGLYSKAGEAKSCFRYRACRSAAEAMTGADFVIVSILPGSFEEMESDVHTPEAYGIYQSVGDTTGPGGIVRAMRTVPMMQEIAEAVKSFCPKAWVINYTNPMSLCVRTLYETFPEIRAFGCCHEVFGTQKLLASAVEELCGIEGITRQEIKVEVTGVNHFTFLIRGQYRDLDLFPLYRRFAERYAESGFTKKLDPDWRSNPFRCNHRVKMDLFLRFGAIAAADDRHLAEFCPGDWYLASPERAAQWGFSLTPVSWRKQDLQNRLAKSRRLLSGEEKPEIKSTGEEGVRQIRALLGLGDFVTNVNLPNRGQVPDLPLGAVVETNASFRDNSVTPVLAGAMPEGVRALVERIVSVQEDTVKGAILRDPNRVLRGFLHDPLVEGRTDRGEELFEKMVENTKGYLGDYSCLSLRGERV